MSLLECAQMLAPGGVKLLHCAANSSFHFAKELDPSVRRLCRGRTRGSILLPHSWKNRRDLLLGVGWACNLLQQLQNLARGCILWKIIKMLLQKGYLGLHQLALE
jgi:hypothetical protein